MTDNHSSAARASGASTTFDPDSYLSEDLESRASDRISEFGQRRIAAADTPAPEQPKSRSFFARAKSAIWSLLSMGKSKPDYSQLPRANPMTVASKAESSFANHEIDMFHDFVQETFPGLNGISTGQLIACPTLMKRMIALQNDGWTFEMRDRADLTQADPKDRFGDQHITFPAFDADLNNDPVDRLAYFREIAHDLCLGLSGGKATARNAVAPFFEAMSLELREQITR